MFVGLGVYVMRLRTKKGFLSSHWQPNRQQLTEFRYPHIDLSTENDGCNSEDLLNISLFCFMSWGTRWSMAFRCIFVEFYADCSELVILKLIVSLS